MGNFMSIGRINSSNMNPKLVILLSGKRKSGKDYVANVIQKQ